MEVNSLTNGERYAPQELISCTYGASFITNGIQLHLGFQEFLNLFLLG